MKRIAFLVALALATAVWTSGELASLSAAPPVAALAEPNTVLHQAALDAVSSDANKSAQAIQTLRAAGPAGLDALIVAAFHQTPIRSALPGELILPTTTPEQTRLRAAMDQVAMQKDAMASHLYWHTELEQAKKAAAAENKPILSLRLLGKLNEDLSCANSRFFRTTLYANSAVSKYLRENYVLHWESVRPVPVITIDMGDGRKIVRTITGNSIHYVLDSKGRVMDGIPGLYGSQAFLRALQINHEPARIAGRYDDAQYLTSLKAEQSYRLRLIMAAWQTDLARVNPGNPPTPAVNASYINPTAVTAARRADSKLGVEMPLLVQIMPDGKQLAAATTDDLWDKIAALHAQDASIDASVKDLMLAKSPDLAQAAMKAAFSKRKVEDPLLRVVQNLESSIALDTVKNEYQMHSKIREWLAQSDKPVVLKSFNDRVYAELFLTPGTDPWLGLVPADIFSALDNGGVCPPASVVIPSPN